MKSFTALPVLALAGLGLAKPCGDRCVQDACYKGALSGYPWCDRVRNEDKEQCSSFLASTVTPSAVTITSTVIVATTPTSFSSETATDTQLTTDVETSSVVDTEIDIATSTTTLTETVTETETSTSTTTLADGNTPAGQFPNKRTAVITQTATATATAGQLPGTIGAHCNADQYSSVCHCFGVKIPTVTASAETVTETETATVTGATVIIQTTVTTVTTTVTAATITTTIPFSTFTTTNTITTETSLTTDTTTTTASTTTTISPPIQTIAIRNTPYNTNQDPSQSGDYAIAQSRSAQSSFINFQTTASGAAVFGLNTLTGELTILGTGTGAGQSLYYSASVGSTSYILAATPDYAASQGGQLIKCRTTADNGLQCIWKNTQIAEFWLCGGHLNLVQPGYDFTNTCAAGGTSTRVNVGASPASI